MIALSFDIEEFDLPLEHGYKLPFDRQIAISRAGAEAVLDILKRHDVRATFFSTVNFAKNAPGIISRIVSEGHELASHGMEHSRFEVAHLKQSKIELERLSGMKVRGYRQARMMKLPEHAIADAGYLYDSSLNPTFIPGRYMNLKSPRRPFFKDGVLQIPASVSPLVRFPMFWLSAHVLPPGVYRAIAKATLKNDKTFNTYFHPWEFFDLNSLEQMGIPFIAKINSGEGMQQRLSKFISAMKKKDVPFVTYHDIYLKYAGKR